MTLPTPKHKHKVRPIRVEGDVAYVTLTRGLVAIIDAADAHVVANRNWQAIPREDGHTFYVAATVIDCGKRRMVQMHRAITEAPTDEQVDHKDGNGLDCRRHNLRVCTRSRNQQNRRRTSNMYGLKGVYKDHARDKFCAKITIDGKQTNLGRFATPEAAGRAYDQAALIHFGEFAATNAALGLL